jgi:hypothetical protein
VSSAGAAHFLQRSHIAYHHLQQSRHLRSVFVFITFPRILLSTTVLARKLLWPMCLLPPQILYRLRCNLPPCAAPQVQFEMPTGQEARTSHEHVQTSAEFRSLLRECDAGNEIFRLLYNEHSRKEFLVLQRQFESRIQQCPLFEPC